MSAGSVLQAAVAGALEGMEPLAVFDAPPVRAALPYAVVDEPVLRARAVQGWQAREGSVAVVLHDAGERPVRLRQLMGAVEDRLEDLEGALGEGWRLLGFKLARSRIVAAKGGRWMGMAEFSCLLWRENG